MEELSDNTISDISPQAYKIKQYKPPSFLSQFSYMLIRPPRFLYGQQLLNPPEKYSHIFTIEQHSIPFKLTIYTVKNMLYVILYLHGNSSSRFQGYMHLKELPEGVGLACFDFQGCGNRDGQFVTLGLRESQEIDVAAQYLKNLGYQVVGWGRSMGSVGLLLSEVCDVVVADSPFASLGLLCKETAYKFVPSYCCCFFHCFFPCVFACVQSDVEEKAKFKINELQIVQKVASNPRNKSRSLFLMAGTQDGMIDFTHSQTIFEQFPGHKWLELFEGSHNSQRPNEVYDKCFQWIQKQLKIERKKKYTKSVDLETLSNKFGITLNKQELISTKMKQSQNSCKSKLKIEVKQSETELTTIGNIIVHEQKKRNCLKEIGKTEEIKIKSETKQESELMQRKQSCQDIFKKSCEDVQKKNCSLQQIPVILLNKQNKEDAMGKSSNFED